LLPGALELAASFQAAGLRANRQHFEPQVEYATALDERLRALLYDPQTSGGLLLFVPEKAVEALMADLSSARRIGRAVVAGPSPIRIV
jgi:selenide,water dikinase